MRTPAVFLFLIILSLTLVSQPCLPDGITFSTQAQIDSFPILYPNCTEIEGSVLISGSDITDLSGLNGIIHIGGDLKFLNNDSLTSMNGLNNLTEIGGSLIIGSTDVPGGGENPMLSALAGLDNLEGIGGSLVVCRNHILPDFEGLGSLKSIGYSLYCTRNISLLNFSGLDELDSLGHSLTVGGNPSLQDFSGLEGLNRINNSLILGDCQAGYGGAFGGNGQATYIGLHNIEFVGGHLGICQTERDHITGLEKIIYVGGKLFIDLNDNLFDLSGLDSLMYVGDGLEIGYIMDYGGEWFFGNHSLTDITALMGITSVGGGTIHIEDNPMLTSLSGLDNIDPESIGSLFVAKQNSLNIHGRLTWCSVKSICDYLDIYGAIANFGGNGPDPGCNSKLEVEENCEDSGINDQEIRLSVVIYPVPTNKDLNISVSGDEELTGIVIYDRYGRELLRYDEHKDQIDISDFSPGMYFITLSNDKTRVVKKFIVK